MPKSPGRKIRRRRGEGSIEQFADGSCRAYFTIGAKDDGSQDRVSQRFDSIGDAQNWLAELIVLKGKGGNLKPDKKTFGELLNDWLSTQKATVAGNTYTKYEYNSRHLADLLSADPKAAAEKLQTLLNYLSTKLAPETIKGVYAVARGVLDIAYDKEMIMRMPKIKLPRVEPREPRVLESEQLQFLIAAAKTSKYHYGLWIELGTGLRRGMLLALDWADFDWNENTVVANKRMVRLNGEWEIKSGAKTRSGSRIYDVPPAVMAVLKPLYKYGKPVFETETGSRLSLWNWSRLYRSWRKHADLAIKAENEKRLKEHSKDPQIKLIGDTRFHDLRHLFSSSLQDLGVHIFTIQDMGGWADADMARRYSHTKRTATRAASKKLSKIIAPLLSADKIKIVSKKKEKRPELFQ